MLAVCGVVGPPIYVIVLIIAGFFRPGYNHFTQNMSELGEIGHPDSIIMNIFGFPLLGLFLISFSLGLHMETKNGLASKSSSMLIAVSGIGLVFTGIFPCNPGCIDVSLTGYSHSIAAMISSFSMMFAPFAVLPRLSKDSKWKSYSFYTFVTGIVTAILSAVYGFGVFEQWKGAMQRVSMGVPLLWIEVIAIKLLRNQTKLS